jgi:hypothetical protein
MKLHPFSLRNKNKYTMINYYCKVLPFITRRKIFTLFYHRFRIAFGPTDVLSEVDGY